MIGKYIKQIDKIFPKPSRQKTEVELLVSRVYKDAQNDLRNEILRRANVRK
jgi:hypothetical protein